MPDLPTSAPSDFTAGRIVATAFVTFGLAVGIPYYNLPFSTTTFKKPSTGICSRLPGFSFSALLTIWVGPLLIPKMSPKKLIVAGTGLTGVALFGFSRMDGSLPLYFFLYFVYTVGYHFLRPYPPSDARFVLVPKETWDGDGHRLRRCWASSAALEDFSVKPMSENYGFRTALMVLAGIMFLRGRSPYFF